MTFFTTVTSPLPDLSFVYEITTAIIPKMYLVVALELGKGKPTRVIRVACRNREARRDRVDKGKIFKMSDDAAGGSRCSDQAKGTK